jgi:hypothetical protein
VIAAVSAFSRLQRKNGSCLRQYRRRYQPSPAIGCRQSWRPQRASEILVRVVKREHLPRVHRITRSLKNAALRTFTQALLVSKPSRMNPSTVMTTRSSTRRLRCWLSRLVTISQLVWSYSGLESTWLENAHFVEVERHPLYTRICASARDL